jgi:hypothetical protein
VLAGWRGAAANDWDSVAALDAELARFAAGAPLYEEAIRLRIRWRLARPDPAGGAEAQALAERLLARRWSAEDELLRARAALLAQQPVAAWGSLSRVASALPNHPRAAALAASSLEIAKALPEPLGQGLRSRLRDLPRPAAG